MTLMTRSMSAELRGDLKAREAHGMEKYGTALQPWNGRNPIEDAYEESMDNIVYLKQAKAERQLTVERLRMQAEDMREQAAVLNGVNHALWDNLIRWANRCEDWANDLEADIPRKRGKKTKKRERAPFEVPNSPSEAALDAARYMGGVFAKAQEQSAPEMARRMFEEIKESLEQRKKLAAIQAAQKMSEGLEGALRKQGLSTDAQLAREEFKAKKGIDEPDLEEALVKPDPGTVTELLSLHGQQLAAMARVQRYKGGTPATMTEEEMVAARVRVKDFRELCEAAAKAADIWEAAIAEHDVAKEAAETALYAHASVKPFCKNGRRVACECREACEFPADDAPGTEEPETVIAGMKRKDFCRTPQVIACACEEACKFGEIPA